MMTRQQAVSACLSMLQVVTGLVLSAALARMMSVDDYGLYATLVSAILMLAVLTQFGLPDIIMRETAITLDEDPGRVRALWATSDILTVPTIVVASILAIIGMHYFPQVPQDMMFTIIFLLHLPVMAMSAMRAASLRGLGYSNRAHFGMNILPHILTILTLGAVFLCGVQVSVWSAILISVLSLTIAFATLSIMRSFVSSAFDRDDCRVLPKNERRFLRRESLPMAGVAGLGIFNSQVDILMLGYLAGAASAGLYQVSIATALILSLTRARLAMTITPRLAVLWRRGQSDEMADIAAPVTVAASLISLIAFIASILYGDSVLSALFGNEFAGAAPALSIICAAWLIAACLGLSSECLVMSGHQRITLRTAMISAAINVCLNPVFIPQFGPTGAAITLLISVAWYHGYHWHVARSKLGLKLGVIAATRSVMSHTDARNTSC